MKSRKHTTCALCKKDIPPEDRLDALSRWALFVENWEKRFDAPIPKKLKIEDVWPLLREENNDAD